MMYLKSDMWFVDWQGDVEIKTGKDSKLRGAEPIWIEKAELLEMLKAVEEQNAKHDKP